MNSNVIPHGHIEQSIFLIRGQKVMLDFNLATLYGVQTRALIQAIKRNRERFPPDFMFQLDDRETDSLRSQIVISNMGRGGRRYNPYAFTEYGVAMLSSVLRSHRAIIVNIEIMRTFGRLREMLSSHKELAQKLAILEKKYDHQFKVVFDAIRRLMTPPRTHSAKERISRLKIFQSHPPALLGMRIKASPLLARGAGIRRAGSAERTAFGNIF